MQKYEHKRNVFLFLIFLTFKHNRISVPYRVYRDTELQKELTLSKDERKIRNDNTNVTI